MTGPSGAWLGSYPLLGELGRGGFGEVFLSEDPWSGCRMALKRAGPRDGAADRLIQEFSIHSSLTTPVLPQAGRLGQLPDGQVYITMERLRGRGVMWAARRAGAPCSLRRQRVVQEILAGLLGSLAALHDVGIIHCDLKTRNLYLHPSGAVRLLDLGAARRLDPHTRSADGQHFMGTPRYAPPEQRDRLLLDVRTDLFSVGALGLRLITDEKPEWPPTPPAGLDPTLAALLETLLALEPERRPASAQAALALLGLPPVPARWWSGSAVVNVAEEAPVRERRATLLAKIGTGLTIHTHGAAIGAATAPLWTTDGPATLLIRELHAADAPGRETLSRLLRRALRQDRPLHLRATAAPDPSLREDLPLATFCPPPRLDRLSVEGILHATASGRWGEALRAARGADPLLPIEQPMVRAAAICWSTMGQRGEASRLLRDLPAALQTPLPDLRPPGWAAALDQRDLEAALRWLEAHGLDQAPEARGGALLTIMGNNSYSSAPSSPSRGSNQ